MKIAYEDWNPKPESAALVKKANAIIAEYSSQGLDLTLRQLYYQLVSRDVIPNNVREYKKLGDLVSKARRAGLIDWDSIVDRTRYLRSLNHWDNPEDILGAVASQFKQDAWKTQPSYVEVWFEKDALLGVFERPANRWRVPFFSCRGYVSDSEVWAAAQRIARVRRGRRNPIILHFGDHDPSGIDMSRDIEDRLSLFGSGTVDVKRIALNFDQIEEYDPPPNPAKESDSRFEGYQARFGDESWELDALDPKTLAALVTAEVEKVIDTAAWQKHMRGEAVEKARLRSIAERYEDVVEFLGEPEDEPEPPASEEEE